LARARRPAPAIVSQRNVERDKPGHLFLKKDPENLQLGDYDRLYADKLGLLLAINENEQVSWESPFRSPLKDALVAPQAGDPDPNLARHRRQPRLDRTRGAVRASGLLRHPERHTAALGPDGRPLP
jgi:hypothetical protein